MKPVKVIFAIFLPPVAAFMQVGVSVHFWVNIILCILGFVPGMVHALWLVLTDQKKK
ncbi:MAG: YqaE/Pmp3 family membrane protein [Candidatus Omnitrophica bacterium]|nr:YqaE/Pmp3 family membrane protein [Candidatus Omnitrophota bacterium]